jgi:hypothetical protein
MKYQVGDLVLVKDCKYKPRLHLRHHLLPRLRLRPALFNSFGIVIRAIKHSDTWRGDSTGDNNVYVWYSQVDSKEYSFYEDEVDGEII